MTLASKTDKSEAQGRAIHEGDLPSISGVATFLGAPYEDLSGNIDIALVGVPFDGGVLFRPGARLGPRDIRNNSAMIGRMNHQTGIKPFELCKVADIGDVPLANIHHLESSLSEIESYTHKILEAGAVPIAFGGDHSISFPILKAMGADAPVGLVHFDAHCDTGSEAYNNKFHHGGPFKNAVESGVLDPQRTIQIGIRGTAEENWEFSYESGMSVVHIEDVKEMGSKNLIKKIHEVIGEGPAYLSFDVDCLDPAFAPGTGTPEIGGLSSFEAQQLLRGLRGLDLIGADIVEVAPAYDNNGLTSLVAANLGFEILCLLSENAHLKR